jgi:hypothetical protein
MIEVELPDGTIAEFPDGTAPDVMKQALQKRFGAPQQAAQQPVQPQQAPALSYQGGTFRAATEGSHAGLMGGFDDEITAGMLAPIDAAVDWFKGDGFDMGKAYTRKQQALDAQKGARRAEHPVASLGGEVAGGLALGGGAAKAGLTTAGRAIPMLSKAAPRTAATLGAVGEGAAYGGLYGAGEAAPDERLQGAGVGAAIGGLAGGALQTAGNALATRSARKAAAVATPASDDLKTASQSLYRASEREGVRYGAQPIQKLGANLKMAAGKLNDRLRPKTAGFIDDIDDRFTGDMSMEAFDEFRKELNLELRRASPSDSNTLSAMKRTLDNFADNVKPGDFTGDASKATGLLKDARKTWAQAAKTDAIEKILDVADVDGAGKYTQSGFANAVRQEMKSLYKSIVKGKSQHGWTKEEIALIRQMAAGGANSRIVNLFAKFAPRGVVSALAGPALGGGVGGPIGAVAVPLAGHLAGRAADRGAMAAAQALRTGAATGTAPRIAEQISRKAPPFIGAGAAASTEVPRLLEGRR